MKQRLLGKQQILARMRRGLLPVYTGGITVHFPDGSRAALTMMRELARIGLIEYPAHTSVDSPFTLGGNR